MPEAFHQWFGSCKKGDKSHLEFACDLSTHFDRWCSAAEVRSHKALCDLIFLEQFENSVPKRIATYSISVGGRSGRQLRPLLWLMIMFLRMVEMLLLLVVAVASIWTILAPEVCGLLGEGDKGNCNGGMTVVLVKLTKFVIVINEGTEGVIVLF